MRRLTAFIMTSLLFIVACHPQVPERTGTVVSPLLPEGRVALTDQGARILRHDCSSDVRRPRAQSIVDIAASQWRRFGYGVTDRTGQWTHASLASEVIAAAVPGAPTIPASEAHIRTERDPIGHSAIAAYWSTVDYTSIQEARPDPESFLARHVRQSETQNSSGQAWSAAFVSWVLCEAGAEGYNFPRRANHSEYISALRSNTNGEAWYHVRSASEVGPINPGDLICYARTAVLDSQFAAGTYLGHCDIVVHVDFDRKNVLAIGGNVRNTVMLSIFGLQTAHAGALLSDLANPDEGDWTVVLNLLEPGTNALLANSFMSTPGF